MNPPVDGRILDAVATAALDRGIRPEHVHVSEVGDQILVRLCHPRVQERDVNMVPVGGVEHLRIGPPQIEDVEVLAEASVELEKGRITEGDYVAHHVGAVAMMLGVTPPPPDDIGEGGERDGKRT